jgi:acetylornithine deacetylase/succinyl-diaminopimelate desuccinylase-like protein
MSDLQDLDRCIAFFDVTSVPSMTPESVQEDLRHIFQAIRDQQPEFDAEIDMRGWEPPLSDNYIWGAHPTPEDSDVVQCVAKHHTAVRGTLPADWSGAPLGDWIRCSVVP